MEISVSSSSDPAMEILERSTFTVVIKFISYDCRVPKNYYKEGAPLEYSGVEESIH